MILNGSKTDLEWLGKTFFLLFCSLDLIKNHSITAYIKFFFGIADVDLEIRKLKILDPVWQTGILKARPDWLKIADRVFLKTLILNPVSKICKFKIVDPISRNEIEKK